jgi:hypothetical protein
MAFDLACGKIEAMQGKPEPVRINRAAVLQLAAEASCDPRTVLRVLRNDGGHTAQSLDAIVKAAKRLGIELPADLVSRSTLQIRAT